MPVRADARRGVPWPPDARELAAEPRHPMPAPVPDPHGHGDCLSLVWGSSKNDLQPKEHTDDAQ
jgi:hypothetical protein